MILETKLVILLKRRRLNTVTPNPTRIYRQSYLGHLCSIHVRIEKQRHRLVRHDQQKGVQKPDAVHRLDVTRVALQTAQRDRVLTQRKCHPNGICVRTDRRERQISVQIMGINRMRFLLLSNTYSVVLRSIR